MFKRHYYTLLLLLLQTVNATQHQQWQQLSEDALEAGNQEESPDATSQTISWAALSL